MNTLLISSTAFFAACIIYLVLALAYAKHLEKKNQAFKVLLPPPHEHIYDSAYGCLHNFEGFTYLKCVVQGCDSWLALKGKQAE